MLNLKMRLKLIFAILSLSICFSGCGDDDTSEAVGSSAEISVEDESMDEDGVKQKEDKDELKQDNEKEDEGELKQDNKKEDEDELKQDNKIEDKADSTKDVDDELKTDINDESTSEEKIQENDSAERLEFVTTDIYGNAVASTDFTDAKIIMLNFWEPWCGPCVGEMPELETLYEEYKESGFVIIGAFTTEGMDDAVLQVLADTGVKYPIVYAAEEMYKYMSDYVPTTVFLDGEGHILSDEPYIGANSYDNWKKIIEANL